MDRGRDRDRLLTTSAVRQAKHVSSHSLSSARMIRENAPRRQQQPTQNPAQIEA